MLSSQNFASLFLLLGALLDIATRKSRRKAIAPVQRVTKKADSPSPQYKPDSDMAVLAGDLPARIINRHKTLVSCPITSNGAE